ncbi:MAG: insulinase family protein [Chloroflexi bacterium]|nr:insulinase family protein [Chloroflexota bacterium]
MDSKVVNLKLSNGLLVLLKEIHTAPLVSQWLWYRVGSRDEEPGITGASHWVEHMLFKGTEEFPGGVLDKAIARYGGFWNAMTYIDWTTYLETLPADKIDLALRFEADRMGNSTFDKDEVDSERTVIISERQGNENNPLFLLDEKMQAAAFQVHPYTHEVIGDMADLESMSREDLYTHYRAYYLPNNAVLAIAGDFETDKMLARIRELFDDIPAGDVPPRKARPEPKQTEERRLTVSGPGETTFLKASYHAPEGTDPDFFALTVLDSLLAGPSSLNMFGGGISNKTSRLYRALVERELTVSVSAGLQATIDPYLYNITMTVHPETSPEDVITALDKEIKRLFDTVAGADELARAVKQARALFAYGSESISNQAFWLGFAEMFGNYEWFQSYLDKLAEVSPQDVQRVAQKYLTPQNRVLGIYLPDNNN